MYDPLFLIRPPQIPFCCCCTYKWKVHSGAIEIMRYDLHTKMIMLDALSTGTTTCLSWR